MILRTLGHATLALYQPKGDPLLLTDPWLVGSAYWRSWWLQHYPNAEELEWMAKSQFVAITHEHPDHFHMPSIRRLGTSPTYLFPALPEQPYIEHMAAAGFDARLLRPGQWKVLGDGVSVLSLPVLNDDSLLLIDTPDALVLNFNDVKPLPSVIKAIRKLARQIDKPRILLCSYSPASLVNSFTFGDDVVSLKTPEDYVNYLSVLCNKLDIDTYIPFASQTVFLRPDSRWANDFRVSFNDLQRYWSAGTKLMPPYTTLDLTDLTGEHIAFDDYRSAPPTTVVKLVASRLEEEQNALPSMSDIASLEHRLNAWRWLLRTIFPRGFSFLFDNSHYLYRPSRGRISHAERDDLGDFVISVPPLVLSEALRNHHLADLGITMFVKIRLRRKIDPRKIYLLFLLLQFDDYEHKSSIRSFLRWLAQMVRYNWTLQLPKPG